MKYTILFVINNICKYGIYCIPCYYNYIIKMQDYVHIMYLIYMYIIYKYLYVHIHDYMFIFK